MFHGSMVALVTPMHTDGSIDYEALEKLVEFHVEGGTDAIVAVGTTGESATLNEREHCDVIRFVVEKTRGRTPIIAGTGSNSTIEAIDLSRCAMESGADGLLLVTPYYNKPTQHGLIAHYTAIAKAIALPQILYNVPGRTACDMLPETVEKLSHISNIVGIKEASGKVSRAKEIVDMCGERMEVYSGDDALALDVMEVGGKGVISVTANVAPHAMHEMMAAALKGEFAHAREINKPLELLHQNLFLEANPIPVKWALAEMGMIQQGIRLPMTVLSEAFHEPLRNAMQQAAIKLTS